MLCVRMLPWHEACSGVVQCTKQGSREAGRAEPWDRSQEAPGPALASARVAPTRLTKPTPTMSVPFWDTCRRTLLWKTS